MKMFSPKFSNETYDLDDIDTYIRLYPRWYDLSWAGLWKEAWRDAGEALVYMQYWHSDVSFGEQVARIDDLCKELMDLNVFQDTKENRIKLMSWRFRFADEVENMC